MNKYEKLLKLKDSEFKLITGIPRKVFETILEVLLSEYKIRHAKGGRKGVPVEMRLVIALEYWREYRSMRHMAFDYEMPVSTLCDCITWVEDILSESEEFKLKDLKERFQPNEDEDTIKIILVDVEEQPIERPKYGQENSYSGKKRDIQPNTKS